MTDINNNPDCVIDISEDNAEEALKEEEHMQKKYFNGGKVVLTKINVENKKKKTNIVKKPLVTLYILFINILEKMGIEISHYYDICYFYGFINWLYLFSNE